MTFAASIHTLSDTTITDRADERSAQRLADVRSLIAREMHEVEELIARHMDAGVAPATDSAKHLFDAGGKRVRPTALLLAHACWSPIGEKARGLAAAAELVHMATLLHDDVIDDGDQRRGRPTSRRIWGNAVSVLAGDLLLVEALRLSGGAAPVTWQELVATLGKLVNGEVIQLRGRVSLLLDEALYFEIVRGKTASLFEWALRAGAREGGAPEVAVDALGRFGSHLGVAFQLVDDILDYDGDPSATGKSMLADLGEGKITLPLLRAAITDEAAFAALVSDVRAGSTEAAMTLAARVRSSGACDEVRALALGETSCALACLQVVPDCRARHVLADVAKGLAARVG